jgi:putative flippase GtrA
MRPVRTAVTTAPCDAPPSAWSSAAAGGCFALFGLIGGLGFVVHLATLWVALNLLAIGFSASQAIATMVVMTLNFVLTSQFTYRDQRLRGLKLVRGLAIFYLIFGIGAIANVGVASYAFTSSTLGGGPGGGRLGLEFRDVVRFHLARTVVLKFDDGGWRSIAKKGYIVIWSALEKQDASFQAAGSGGFSSGHR